MRTVLVHDHAGLPGPELLALNDGARVLGFAACVGTGEHGGPEPAD